MHDSIAHRLSEGRTRTFLLIDSLSDAELHVQHDPLMSPIAWDLGHIAHFEELWLVRNLEGPVEFGEMPGIFNPFEHPRRVRGALTLPSLAECRALMAEIRGRALEKLARVQYDTANASAQAGPAVPAAASVRRSRLFRPRQERRDGAMGGRARMHRHRRPDCRLR
jgi:hypothetical protein